MSWFVYVIRVSGGELSMDEGVADRKPPERQSAVRDRVMQRVEEPNASRALTLLRPRDAVGLGQISKMGRGEGTPPYFGTVRLQPFYCAEFAFKEGDLRITQFADFAESAGHTSIAIPFHNHLTAEEIDYVACVLERALGEAQ